MKNKILKKITSVLYPIQLKIEIVLVVAFLMGLILKDSKLGSTILIISLASLSMLYYIMAFHSNPKKTGLEIFFNKIMNISFAIGMIGILFTTQHYPGSEQMILVAGASVLLALLGVMYIKIKNNESDKIVDMNLLRIAILLFIILMIFLGFLF